jgi:transglycosylase-like protein with SLT domain
VVAVCSLAGPNRALAWESPAGSPPGWQPRWIQTTERVDVFVNANGDSSFGEVPAGLYFRIDAPEQNGRYWVYDPLLDSWAWLPRSGAQPAAEPTPDQVAASASMLDARAYLYFEAPDLAPRLDCIIANESGWDPSQVNGVTRAAGLAQFLPSTWAATPQGVEGLSPFDPTANVDAAIWLARTKGWRQWQVYINGTCH